jgi:hypothetical protein
MNNPKNFETEIREKLDNHRVHYQESYWKAYNETYPQHWYQKIHFSWKLHAILAYSLLSFALGYFCNSTVYKKSSVAATSNGQLPSKTSNTGSSLSQSLISPEKKEGIQSMAPTYMVNGKEMDHPLPNGSEYLAKDSVYGLKISSDTASILAAVPATSDSSSSKIAAELNPVNKVAEGLDTSEGNKDPDTSKMNQKKGGWQWGIGLTTAVFLPYKQGEVIYNLGIHGGIAAHLKRNRWSLQTGLLYGVNYVVIDDVNKADINVSHEFSGFKSLPSTPEDVRLVTQTMAPHIGLEYALWNNSKFGLGISAGILGILPIERQFIYDYVGQNPISVSESQIRMDPFKLIPNAGLLFWYQLRSDWQLQLQTTVQPTMFDSPIHEKNAVAPFSIQLGIRKYW